MLAARMSGMSMGGMSMGGAPNLFVMQQMFWAVVGTAIGIATLVNLINRFICWQRLRAARNHDDNPTRPNSLFFVFFATLTATAREITNASCPINITRRWRVSTPTVGRVLLVLAELTTVIVLCFYALDTKDQWEWEDIGYRTGFIAAAQLPLIVLLAGKHNIIGFLIGSSYERLNWLHRWAARILFLTVTIHMGFWFTSWERYDYIKVKLKKDAITQRGFAAWCILLWIVLSSFAPIRTLSYEFFVVQHIITFVGFLAAVYLHLPAEEKVWIWLPIGFYIFDRTIRSLWILWTNLYIFHPKSRRGGNWTLKANMEPLDGDMTRVVIKNPPVSWRPGQHVLLACHGLSPFQSHPFTISSLPQDGHMEFLIKSKSGCTKRFFRYAKRHETLPRDARQCRSESTCSVIIDGPYGYVRPLRQFDSIFFIAGSNGISFTLPLMRDVIDRWKTLAGGKSGGKRYFDSSANAAVRYIRFVWVVKSQSHTSWYSSQLAQAMEDVRYLQHTGQEVQLDITIYTTCAVDMVGEYKDTNSFKLKCLPAPAHNDELSGALSSRSPVTSTPEEDLKTEKTTVSIHSTLSPSPGPNPAAPVQANCNDSSQTKSNCCCCQQTISDEESDDDNDKKDNIAPAATCTCHANYPTTSAPPDLTTSSSSSSSTRSSSFSKTPSNPLITPVSPSPQQQHPPLQEGEEDGDGEGSPKITFLTGRPSPKHLIRKTLEQALGETAVVACGPKGLERDTRAAVVSLSDERAVCKGSGALGVWFWGEGFGD